MKKIQSLIGVLCVLTLCICMSGCNQTEKNEDKIGVGNPEEELAVSPYTSGETDEGITNLGDINMSIKIPPERNSTRLNSSHSAKSRIASSA